MFSNQYAPTLVATLRGKKVVKAVSAAESVLILTADDKVYACGAFDTQMSGSSRAVNQVYPTLLPVVDAPNRVIDIQCGAYHYAAMLQSIPKVEAPQVEALLQTVPVPVPETLVIDSEEKWTREKPLNTKLLVWGAFPAANTRSYTHPIIFDAPATLTQVASGSAHVIYLDADHQVYATGRFECLHCISSMFIESPSFLSISLLRVSRHEFVN